MLNLRFEFNFGLRSDGNEMQKDSKADCRQMVVHVTIHQESEQVCKCNPHPAIITIGSAEEMRNRTGNNFPPGTVAQVNTMKESENQSNPHE